MNNIVDKEETKQLKEIQEKYYMIPVLSRINKFIEDGKNTKIVWKKLFCQSRFSRLSGTDDPNYWKRFSRLFNGIC